MILFGSGFALNVVFIGAHSLSKDQSQGALLTLWKLLFAPIWGAPMYTLTQLLGVQWYDKLYQLTSHARRVRVASPSMGASASPITVNFYSISEQIMKFVVTLIFGLAAVAVAFFPLIGPFISFVMRSFLHAFYCFDYRFLSTFWMDTQRQRRVRLSMIDAVHLFERKWAYHLGFGGTHIAMCVAMEWKGFGVLSILAVSSFVFAINVMTTVDAAPPRREDSTPVPLPVFTFLIFHVSRLQRIVLSGSGSSAVHEPLSAPQKMNDALHS